MNMYATWTEDNFTGSGIVGQHGPIFRWQGDRYGVMFEDAQDRSLFLPVDFLEQFYEYWKDYLASLEENH